MYTLQNSKMTSKFLEGLGINEDALIGLEDLPCLTCRDLLSNGAIVELASFRQKKGLRWRVLGG